MTAAQLIDKTAKSVVSELKRAGMIRENRLNSYQKTEKILFLYPKLKSVISDYEIDNIKITREFVRLIGEALRGIGDDPYFEIIPLKYFEGKTHEQIAEYFDVQPAAISKQRKRLVNRLRGILFSDDFISELYNNDWNINENV